MTERDFMSGIQAEHVSHCYGGLPVLQDMNLEVGSREILTLLGPSGCGKTTMLRLLAGLEELQEGSITVDGNVLANGVINVPPENRSVSLLFQDFALFPHLTVIDNIIFGLKNWPTTEKRARALHVLDQVGMIEFADIYPHQLSGGQQQRVALARARGPRPRIMLMDEPFSNLDTSLRRQVREIVLWVLQNSVSATVMVTHDPEEAMFMSDRIAVVNEGRIVQMGTPEELYHDPINSFVLGMFGEVNRMEGHVQAGHIETPLGQVCAPNLPEGAPAEVLVRAEGVRLNSDSSIHGQVVTSRMLGRATLLHLDLEGRDGNPLHVHARISDRDRMAINQEVGLSLDDEHVFVFPLTDVK
ncbi:ABC transporter ATP-binding protein [Alphaproteobacteria bacterium]|nr:ABC transporter ATP-binding protein [Alphaproteobacteria bacterium]